MAKFAEKTRERDRKTPSTEPASPEELIARVENSKRREDAERLLPWFESVTEMPAKLWSKGTIIGFGRYRYDYASGRSGEYLITGFSPRKTALSIYVLPGYRDMREKLARLGKHKHGKSCLYINTLSDVELDVLGEIVTEGVAYMHKHYATWKE